MARSSFQSGHTGNEFQQQTMPLKQLQLVSPLAKDMTQAQTKTNRSVWLQASGDQNNTEQVLRRWQTSVVQMLVNALVTTQNDASFRRRSRRGFD